MKNKHITNAVITEIHDAIDIALAAKKEYQVSITLFDNSLRARQRALAQIWYSTIDEHLGEAVGYGESLCKYKWGLRILSLNDPELDSVIRRMLEGYDYEKKLAIIRDYPSWFPVLRDKGGMNIEDQARYLRCIQVHFAENGLILSSPNEQELLNCKQAHQ